jgi:uncharacterized membrane protein
MWENEVSTEIAARIEDVYDYLADFPRHKEWSHGVAELIPVERGVIGVGTEYRASETAPFKLATFSRITALNPPRHIAWEASDGRNMRVRWSFELGPNDSRTLLVQRSNWEPTSLMGKVALNLMRKRQVPQENRHSLDRIKAILEEGAA